MKFDSFAEFIAMGGHGPFVWAVYAITLVVLLALALAPVHRSRKFWAEQAMRMKREQAAERRVSQEHTRQYSLSGRE